jgi:hypothetical protein
MPVALEPEDIFRKDLRHWCEDGIRIYCEKYQNCGFKFEGGLRCIARRPGHEEHCDEKGARTPGKYDPSEYQEESTRTINEIRDLFITTYKDLCAHGQRAPGLPDPAMLLRHREDVLEKFAGIWKVTKSNKTCFTCLQSVPDHVLSCGHGYCPDCVKEFGQKSDYYEYGLIMDHCILCQTEWRDEHRQLIRLKPKCAGVRILTLDGGGVRGIIELALLERLELRVGLKLPIRDLFDLIMGTSTGQNYPLSPRPRLEGRQQNYPCREHELHGASEIGDWRQESLPSTKPMQWRILLSAFTQVPKLTYDPQVE